jgi:hypothetical protein
MITATVLERKDGLTIVQVIREVHMKNVSLFVGSSTEGLDIAHAIQDQLMHDANVTLWSDSVFDLGKATLEALLDLTQQFDFAMLILTSDDRATIRGAESAVPRDNVVFELGLFMGRLGRERTFVACDRNLSVWNDLAGITLAQFDASRPDGNVMAALGPACNQIRRTIRRLGPRQAKTSVADFWWPFLCKDSVIVIGHFDLPQFEGSGLIGLGDAMGLVEIQSYCDQAGLPHPPLRDATQLAPGDLGKNLILLGGPDVNRVTDKVIRRIGCALNFGVDAVVDSLTSAKYRPKRDGRDLSQDIGVIIEAANPFDSEKRVLLLFGCFGYGTWAAARFSKTGSFLDALVTSRDVECVLQADVVQASPYAINPILLRHRSTIDPAR